MRSYDSIFETRYSRIGACPSGRRAFFVTSGFETGMRPGLPGYLLRLLGRVLAGSIS